MDFDFVRFITILGAVIISITIHEFAHAASAVAAGDDTPRRQNRLNINPFDHFDIVGFSMIVMTSLIGFGIGWGKPVQVNPNNFKNPRWDDVKVSFWGPLSNILLAVICALLLRFAGPVFVELNLGFFLYAMVLVNLGLALFNLIPLPPLDGSHIMMGLLPYQQARAYAQFARNYGMAVLILILLFPMGSPVVRMIIGPPRELMAGLLLGM